VGGWVVVVVVGCCSGPVIAIQVVVAVIIRVLMSLACMVFPSLSPHDHCRVGEGGGDHTVPPPPLSS